MRLPPWPKHSSDANLWWKKKLKNRERRKAAKAKKRHLLAIKGKRGVRLIRQRAARR